MFKDLSRRRFLAGSTAAAGAVTLGGSLASRAAFAADPLKVGFIYVGPIGDFGWTHGHDLGRRAIEEKFGDAVKTSYVESVSEGPDAERVGEVVRGMGFRLAAPSRHVRIQREGAAFSNRVASPAPRSAKC